MDNLPSDALWEITRHLGSISNRCLMETTRWWHRVINDRYQPGVSTGRTITSTNKGDGLPATKRIVGLSINIRATESVIYHGYTSQVKWLMQRGYPVSYRCWRTAARWAPQLLRILPFVGHAASMAIRNDDTRTLWAMHKQGVLDNIPDTPFDKNVKSMIYYFPSNGKLDGENVSQKELCVTAAMSSSNALELLLRWGLSADKSVYQVVKLYKYNDNMLIARRYGVPEQ